MSAKTGVNKAKKLDLFCWKCHKSETNIGCSRCERSFHNKCISLTKNICNYDSNWVCAECTANANDTTCADNHLDSIQLQQLLLLSLKMISKSADYYFNANNCFADKRIKIDSHLVVNAISLKTIESRIHGFEYKCFRQMVSEFKWLLHNSIICGLSPELTQNAKFLLSKSKSELKDFEECVHCFINYYRTNKAQYYSWFSKPCPRLHPLVWGKVRGHPYWPAKVVKHNQQNHSVLIRFFGTHQKSWVKEKDCLLLSEQSPKPLVGKALQMSKLLDSALEELKYHINYLNNEYQNWFKFAPKLSPFSINQMLTQMHKQNKSHSKPESVETSETTKEKTSSNSTEVQFQNRPIGWKPKARKTFPTPPKKAIETTVKVEPKVEVKPKIEVKAEKTCNPFEITFFKSNSFKKLPKTKPKLEIIEFESNSPKDRKRQKIEINAIPIENSANNEIGFKTVLKNSNSIQTFVNSKGEEDMSEEKNIFIPNTKSDNNETNGINNCKIKAKNAKKVEIKAKVNNKCFKAKSVSQQKTESNQTVYMNKTLKSLREKLKLLEERLKREESLHRQQILEVQQNADLMVDQMRRTLEVEKLKAVTEERNKQKSIHKNNLNVLQRKHETVVKGLKQEFETQLNETKTKIWCFNCLKEAKLYCCSHTYYCSDECQRIHWELHKAVCAQK